jgi:hypothetical protein
LKGNDNLTYEVVQDTRGVHKWKLTSESQKLRDLLAADKRNHVRFYLAPKLTPLSATEKPISASNVKKLEGIRGFTRFDSPKMMSVVWMSLPMSLSRTSKRFTKQVRWDVTRREYEVTLVLDSPQDAREFATNELKDNYGDLADDTWMEGDLLVLEGHELHLVLTAVELGTTPKL